MSSTSILSKILSFQMVNPMKLSPKPKQRLLMDTPALQANNFASKVSNSHFRWIAILKLLKQQRTVKRFRPTQSRESIFA